MPEIFSNPLVQAVAALWILALSLGTAYHALTFKRDPRAALGWIFVCLSLPIVGAIVYVLFGVNRVRTRAQKLSADRVIYSKERGHQIEEQQLELGVLPSNLRYLQGISDKVAERKLTTGNRVITLSTGESAYDAMITAIDAATDRVVLASYIFDSGRSGKRFVEALVRAAERSVEVRVLIDGVGEWYGRPRIGKYLDRAGLNYARFLPPRLIPPTLRLNLRNHRKILVCDGTTAFTGGMNIGDRHIATADGRRRMDDRHFQLDGPVASELEAVFNEDWQFSTSDPLPELQPPKHVPGDLACRVITDGPGEDLDKLSLILHAVIATARDEVWIETPYFLPARELITAIQIAAIRGARVTVLLPAENNMPFVQWAAQNMLWELLQLGVKVYMQPAPFVHTKLLVVDGHYVQIGSANLDARSLRLNFEVAVEIIDDGFAATQVSDLERKRDAATPLTLDELDQRSFPVRLRDSLAWLASPYL